MSIITKPDSSSLKALTIALCLASTVVSTASFSLFPKKTTIHVINGMQFGSPTLSFHCKSEEDDLGFHQPSIGEELNWSFRPKIDGVSTNFRCTFWWNSKQVEVYAYIELIDEGKRNLYYKATEQGVFTSYDNHDWSLGHWW